MGIYYKWQGHWVYQEDEDQGVPSEGKAGAAKGNPYKGGKAIEAKAGPNGGKGGKGKAAKGKDGKGPGPEAQPAELSWDRWGSDVFVCMCRNENPGYEYLRKIKTCEYARSCKHCGIAFGRLAKEAGLFDKGILPWKGRGRSPGVAQRQDAAVPTPEVKPGEAAKPNATGQEAVQQWRHSSVDSRRSASAGSFGWRSRR